MHGFILTNAASVEQIGEAMRLTRATALKVITGWGLAGGWTQDRRQRVANLAQQLVVRTTAGDPSYNTGATPWLLPDLVGAEIGDWYRVRNLRGTFWIELGNEPNTQLSDDGTIWVYRYHLEQTVERCRALFPAAKLIAPALLLNDTNGRRPERWLEICGDVMARCDAIGVHVYEHDAFTPSEQRRGTTGQVARAQRLYDDLDRREKRATPRLVTEYGINDPATPPAIKARRYVAFAAANALRTNGYLAYHLCNDRAVDPQYHLTIEALRAYGEAVKA